MISTVYFPDQNPGTCTSTVPCACDCDTCGHYTTDSHTAWPRFLAWLEDEVLDMEIDWLSRIEHNRNAQQVIRNGLRAKARWRDASTSKRRYNRRLMRCDRKGIGLRIRNFK